VPADHLVAKRLAVLGCVVSAEEKFTAGEGDAHVSLRTAAIADPLRRVLQGSRGALLLSQVLRTTFLLLEVVWAVALFHHAFPSFTCQTLPVSPTAYCPPAVLGRGGVVSNRLMDVGSQGKRDCGLT
jgi:hypothetical protein